MLTLEVLRNLLERGAGTLGEAMFAAKCSVITWYPTDDYYYGSAVLYTLFGDPALRVKRPAPTAMSEKRRLPPTESELAVEPNPARGIVSVNYSLPYAADVAVRLYSEAGELLRTLAVGHRAEGTHRVRLDASDLSCGIYFVRMTFGGAGTRFAKLVIP
jgi:hypothetical protein